MSEKDTVLKRRSQLSQTKQSLLERWIQGKGAKVLEEQAIPRRSAHETVPLSFAQQRLWFLEQLEPGNPFYNIASALDITGKLGVAILQRSFNELIRRHEILRTVFAASDGEPIQIINDPAPLPLFCIDLSSLSETRRMHEARQLANAEAMSSFDLKSGPLLRTTLLRLKNSSLTVADYDSYPSQEKANGSLAGDEEEHILLLSMHHIICDGWSTGVLFHELNALYMSFATEQTSPLAPLSIQYADFAAWQRQWLQGDILAKQLSYWKERLVDAPAFLELSTDHVRPSVPTFRGARYIFSLPETLTKRIHELNRREGTTLFMLLLGAYQLLLARYTGNDDIVVGTPIANRTRVELEGLIGCFVNTLVLRMNFADNPTVRQVLQHVRNESLGAYAHQDLPFEKLVDELQLQRDLSRNPLFQTTFALQNASQEQLELMGLNCRQAPLDFVVAKVDIELNMAEVGQRIVGEMGYCTDLFEASTIARMVKHFQTILEHMVSDPELHVFDLLFLSTEEQQQLLYKWNATAQDYPEDQCLHQLFEEQARNTPDAVAAVYEETHLTYAQLDSRANQVAHMLHRLGVGPEVLVGLCLERSLDVLIGLLGILKAGGGYVPLDPNYPAQRLAFMLTDAEVTVLLTHENLLNVLSHSVDVTICLDSQAEAIAQESCTNLSAKVGIEQTAYVIYTSGSTGQPKGVHLTHQGVGNLALAQGRTFGVQAESHVLQFASLSFDASISEIVMALLNGATLYMAPQERLQPGGDLLELLSHYAITTLTLPPSVLGALPVEEMKGIETLIVAGEASSAALVERWAVGRRMFNAYGPSEATVCVSMAECVAGQEQPSIGQAMANTQLYLLDSTLHPVPIGVIGELYICSVGLARGYLKRPDLTAERFIPHPWSRKAGARLYRTGDRGRYLPTGEIVFVGRTDQQVKVRGFRIELGEIEAILAEHPEVKEAVVQAWEEPTGEKRLVAYVVGRDEAVPTSNKLRSYLQTRLPDYMLPGLFVLLEHLPLSANGKIDRRALPVPNEERSDLLGVYVAARTPAEEILASIWMQVLKREQVGIHDNFFELGGDSIMSIQIITRARQSGLYLTPKQLFQHQTIAQLALVADTPPSRSTEQELVVGLVPLTPIQCHFFAQQLAVPTHFNQSMLLQVQHPLDPALLQEALWHLYLHHDALRLHFYAEETGWQQVSAAPQTSQLLYQVDLSHLLPDEQHLALETRATELQMSLDLTEGPLLRAALFNLGSHQPGRLLIIIHHLVVDTVSWQILLEDLQMAYKQLEHGKSIQLPERTTSFQQWALRLVEYAQSQALRKETTYWLSQPLPPSLPIDFTDGTNTVESVRTVVVELDEVQTRTLLHEIPPVYHTQMNDLLLSALLLACTEWTGQQALLVDMEGHGREDLFADVDLSRTVGWFTDLFPVCLTLPATHEPGNIIKHVKETLRQLPQHGIGYGLLRYLCSDEKLVLPLRTQPQAQMSFNYLGQLDRMLSTGTYFGPAHEKGGTPFSPLNQRPHLLELTAMVLEGRLRIHWRYSEHFHRHQTIEQLAHIYLDTLQSLITHCQSSSEGGYTPSDFSLTHLNQVALDHILAGQREVEDIYPLSPMQLGMLFHSLYESQSGIYCEVLSYRLRGRLEVDAFQKAWQQVVQQHSILRTCFRWEGLSDPVQIVLPAVTLRIELQDWQSLVQEEQQVRWEAFLQEEHMRGFDLTQAPLLRLALIRVGSDSYYFAWTSHHMLLDGWSMAILLKEVLACYESLCQGQSLVLSSSRSYRDYIAWLQQQDQAQAEAYWQQRLSDWSAPTPLGVDHPLADNAEEEAASEAVFVLPQKTSHALQELARREHLTLNTLVQGAWALLLHNYSGQDEVVFGTTVSGRPAELVGVEAMVGLFINTLPVRIRVPDEAKLLQWLQTVQDQEVEMRQYEFSALVDVQGYSAVPRGTPLFQSLVVFENYPIDNSTRQQESKLKVEPFYAVGRTNYPLVLVVLRGRGSEVILQINYDGRRFDAAIIQRLLGHLQILMENMLAAPDQPLANLSILSEGEHNQLIYEWNQTTTAFPDKTCLHTLFEKQVERAGDAVAVVGEDEQLTYRELNRRANHLAHHLRLAGVGPEKIVGLCVERSPYLLIALLGILKAGGAYVPLDPTYPSERLAFMLTEAQVSVVVTTHTQLALTGLGGEHITKVCLDGDDLAWTGQPVEASQSGVQADNLAYVIYTSGSTGRPKGVMIFHRGLVNYLHWAKQAYAMHEGYGAPLHSPPGFDLTVTSLFVPLLAGKRVMLLPEVQSVEPLALALRDQNRFSLVKMTPSHLEVLSRYLPAEMLDEAAEVLIIGGEVLRNESLSFWHTYAPHTRLINEYGPTETVVGCCVYEAPKDATTSGIVPIGRPIANMQMYVLNNSLQPVAVGVPAELYIGGVGVARGYLKRPDLTAACFIPDPFSAEPGARLYRTGDLARYLPTGDLEYLGRLDQQVKIRGFRIELGEIEAVLAEHEAVREAVMLVREDTPGDRRLVAYATSRKEPAPTPELLRGYLKTKLPEYMLPSAFVLLEHLPLTPNGKIDRRALPAPRQVRPGTIIEPRDPLELQLAQILENLLHVSPIGVTDDIFLLGLQSILAMRLATHIQEHFGQHIPLATIFRAATIEQLATIVRGDTDTQLHSHLVPIQPMRSEGTRLPFFCVHPVGGTVFCYMDLAHHLRQDQPFYGVQAVEDDEGPEASVTLEERAARYIKAIQAIQPDGPYQLGGWSFGGVTAFEMAQQLQRSGHEVALLALLDTPAPSGEKFTTEESPMHTTVAHFARNIVDRYGSHLPEDQLPVLLSADELKAFGIDELMDYLLRIAVAVQCPYPKAEVLWVRQLLRANRTGIADIEDYVPQGIYQGQITLFINELNAQLGGSEGPPDGTEPKPALYDPVESWSKFTSQTIEVHHVPGDHLRLVREPYVQVLAEKLRSCLDAIADGL